MGCVNCKNIWRRFFPPKQEKITSSVREEVILAGRDDREVVQPSFWQDYPVQKTVSDSSLISPSELRDTVPPELSENELGRRDPDPADPDTLNPDPENSRLSATTSKSDFSKVENPDEVQVQNHEVQTDPSDPSGPADPTSDSDWQDVNSN